MTKQSRRERKQRAKQVGCWHRATMGRRPDQRRRGR